MIGYPDRPIESKKDNSFGTDTYVEVLSEFITSCETPMTIAIQGDWGTGKTYMMNMIRESLGDDIVSVWFNTWQYSQFNMGDQLPLLLLNKLLIQLNTDDSKAAKELKKMLDGGIKLAKLVSQVGVGLVSQGNASIDFSEFSMDDIEQLVNIKSKFEKAIKEKLSTKSPNARVVVFVDDLDRLQPQKAVEVLETMKIFLDCERCVFVLAVDYDVVARGVKAKYGDTLSDEKGKSFFDKIIQLPFKMPVAKYNIDQYLKKLMTTIWGEIEEDELKDIADYREIIEQSIGKNPRSIKRTVNSFYIINNVALKEGKFANEKDNENLLKQQRKVLFVLLCMQLSYEELYNYILSQASDIQDVGIKGLKEYEKDDEAFAALLSSEYKQDINVDQDVFKNNKEMLDIFIKWSEDLMASARGNKSSALDDILSLSSITASDTKENRAAGKRDRGKIKFGEGEYPKSQLAREVVKSYVDKNPSVTVDELQERFCWKRVTKGVIRLADDPEVNPENDKRRYSKNLVPVPSEGKAIAVWSDWGPSNGFNDYLKEVLSKYM
ncbi:MAG: P-loop NTPase fold protein [Lachnospiraceae bacterium]|nr:P-loop NTPase fold protein [Lachnospiraceae bacterium]